MYKERINAIQELLKKDKIDGYLLFISDYHGSEYVLPHFKSIAYLTGFTGSAATVLIMQNKAYLWTDGRYFLQAEKQLQESNVTLMKIGEEGVLSVHDFINQNLKSLRVDFKIASSLFIDSLNKDIKLIDDVPSYLKKVWKDRPSLPTNKIYLLPEKVCGKTLEEKVNEVRAFINKNNATMALITSLDDIAYLLNFRGSDILYNPVALSYLTIKNDSITLYINRKKLPAKVLRYFQNYNVNIKGYFDIYEDIKLEKGKVIFDGDKTNYSLYASLENKESIIPFISTTMKSIKNNEEIKNIKKVHIKDGIAMCKFFYYVKNNDMSKESEISLADYLEDLRKKQGAIDLSFDTICGFNEHGAIIHYSATKQTNMQLKKDGVLLVDSGGQYKYGTTDITRTFALNNVSDEFKHDYTLVLKAHIALAAAKYKYGTYDIDLDKLVKKVMNKEHKDFKHGTGHGIGFMLNVHEGPQSIRKTKVHPTIMECGMVTSDEPGYYLEGKYGIRHENEILCVKGKDDMLKFENLTYVPFDLDGLDISMLNKKEINYLNKYHQMVYHKISKYLTDSEREYLAYATRKVEYDTNKLSK